MGKPPPLRLDRATLERVIQRAAELQASDHDIGDSLTPDDVLALGNEVGIPRRYLQQALLEEQTRLPDQPATDLLDRMAGPARVHTQRVFRAEPDEVERTLLRWMEQNELLCVQRQQPGRITWEPLSGIPAAIRRSTAALGSGRRPFMLSRASVVTAILTQLEPGYTHVMLSADIRPARGSYLSAGAGLAALGIGTSAVLFALSAIPLIALLPAPIGLGLGMGTVRRFRPIPERVLLGLERALDHVGHGGGRPPRALPARNPGLLDLLADEVRRALKSEDRR